MLIVFPRSDQFGLATLLALIAATALSDRYVDLHHPARSCRFVDTCSHDSCPIAHIFRHEFPQLGRTELTYSEFKRSRH